MKKIPKISILFFSLVFVFLGMSYSVSAATANPNASSSTKAVYQWLSSLPSRSDKRVVSGQYGKRSEATQQFAEIYNETGKWLGMMGQEYGFSFSGVSTTDCSANSMIIDYWNKGGLVTITHHMNNIVSGGNSFDTTSVDFSKILDPSTTVGKNWRETLDKTAACLQELENAGVVVLWRPLHEMQSGHVWWGGKTAAKYKPVWIDMFNYFTYTKGLNNLLWVYSTMPYSASGITGYYPGSSYVDIVGSSMYSNDLTYDPNSTFQVAWDALSSLNEIMAIPETGANIPNMSSPPTNVDYSKLISAIKTRFPKAVFFQVWGGVWGIQSQSNGSKLLSDPWVINRPDVNWKSVSSGGESTGGDIVGTTLALTPSQSCGDNSCNNSETTSSCPQDCPAPAPTYTLSDFTNLVTDWMKSISGSPADVNSDGKVNMRDFGIMMSNWKL